MNFHIDGKMAPGILPRRAKPVAIAKIQTAKMIEERRK